MHGLIRYVQDGRLRETVDELREVVNGLIDLTAHLPDSPGAGASDVTYRQGKLDGALAVGGSATVSIWWNAATQSYYEGVAADSGEDWEDCLSQSVQSSEIAADTHVGVLEIDGVRLVLWAACPE